MSEVEELKRISEQALADERNALSIIASLARVREFAVGSPDYFEVYDRLKALVPPGIYELHKSTPEQVKQYAVFGFGDNTERQGEILVAYSALYPPHQGRWAFRPLVGKGGFLTPVERGGIHPSLGRYFVPRFKFIRKLNHTVADFLADA